MTVEYIRFLPDHVVYSKKSLLHGQLESLNSIKHLHEYKKLRNDELMHKIKLKKLIEETKGEIELLIKNIPQPTEKDEIKEIINIPESGKKDRSLEEELDAIKEKLSKLQ